MTAILPLAFEAVDYAVRGRPLLSDLSFRLDASGTTFVLGANGAGKSLTLRVAHGLLRPTAGQVRWLGAPIFSPEACRRRQAMVFQRPVLLRRSARANVEYALAVHGTPRGARRERTDAVLDRTGLTAFAARQARTLSAGEQQRLAIARAWVLEPEVLLLDEPTAALDPAATRRVEELIERVAATGTKVVMTTHQLGQARRLGDEILFLHGGRLLEQSGVKEFFEAPRTREARAYLEGELLW